MKHKMVRNTVIVLTLMMLVTLAGCYPYHYYPDGHSYYGGDADNNYEHGHDGDDHYRGHHYRGYHHGD